MTPPLVSAVMAVRDCEEFVGTAVRSALSQTFASFELIVVDDASTDSTRSVLGAFGDSRIRVIAGSGSGSASARNQAIREASGSLIAFLDGDDIWDKTHLAEHVAALATNPDVDVSFSLSRFIDVEGRHLRLPIRRSRGRYNFGDLLRDNAFGNGSSVVMRASAMPEGGFNEMLAACIDYELWLRVALRRPDNVLCIAKVLTSYRRHGGQISSDWRAMELSWKAMMDVMGRLAPEATGRAMADATTNWYRYLAFVAFERGEQAEAAKLLARSLRANPRAALANPKTFLVAAAIASYPLSRLVLPRLVAG